MKEKVSIVIPVYNVEQYLGECLESVIHQSFENIEIICIDDASQDGSYLILKEYAQKDARIKIVRNETNKGLSCVRNIGLKLATGKYIYFMDSDDMITLDCIEYLYNTAQKDSLECVLFENIETREIDEGEVLDKGRSKEYRGVYAGIDLLQELVKNKDIIYGVPLQFWNREFLIVNNLQFYEGIYHEDVLFYLQMSLLVKRMKCVKKAFYNYRLRPNSITTRKFAWEHFQAYFITVYEMIRVWNQNEIDNKYDETIEEYISQILYLIFMNCKVYGLPQMLPNLCYGDICVDRLFHIYVKTRDKYETAFFVKGVLSKEQIFEVSTYSTVIVYGAGIKARQVVKDLVNHNIDNFYIVETEKTDSSKKVLGIEVHGIQDLAVKKQDSLVIISVGKILRDELSNNAKSLGYNNIMYIN